MNLIKILPLTTFFTDKMVVKLYRFGAGVVNWIRGKGYCRDIITPQV